MKFFNKILLFFLAMLGFTACEETGSCEYGTPNADYKILGAVVNESKEPIKGIEVSVVNNKGIEKRVTDDKGNFVIEDPNAFPNEEYKLSLKDIDGKDNGGEFEAVDETVSFKGVDHKDGDGNWNSGSAEKSVTVVMKEVKEVEK
ncbi:MAG: radical SAM-associated putative lipoprotein [Bacteroidetes bacterium]|nr:radical SAM-associated putative lipoprotein [Bacteroidota bacterium]